MASIEAQAPDGSKIDIDVPEGTPESSYPKMVDDAVGHYMSTKMSAPEAFGRAAVNNLPLGGQLGAAGTAALSDKPIGYSESLQDWNQKASEAKQQHPIGYGAGAVTGSMAPLAIPLVGEAMEAAPVASGAALGAANAIGNTDVVQNPGEAAKQAAIGLGTGATLGKLLPSGTAQEEGLEQFANKKAVQGLGLKPGMLGIPSEDLDDLGKFAYEAGLTQGSLEQRVNQTRDLLKQTGAQIGSMGAGATPLTDASPFVERLHDKLKESADVFGHDANSETSVYRQALANLSKPNMTFDQLQQLKTAVGQRAFDSVGDIRNQAAADVYSIYKEAMKSIVDGSPQEYQEAMESYGKLKDIDGALTNQFQKEQSGGSQIKGFGLMGKLGAMITGGNVPATGAASVGSLATGHPFWALGLGSTITQNPQAMESAARGLSAAAPGIANSLKMGSIDAVTSYLMNTLGSNPQKLGKFAKPLLQAAQTGGTRGIAAQHFLLSSQYPEYNTLMMGQEKGDASNAQ